MLGWLGCGLSNGGSIVGRRHIIYGACMKAGRLKTHSYAFCGVYIT